MRKALKTLFPRLISPPRVFIALLIVVMAWLLPAVSSRQDASDSVVEFLGQSILNLDIQDAWAWNEECLVCVVTDPAYCSHANPECCKKWKDICPEDPPSYQPPSVSSSIACDVWGNGGWCRQNAGLTVLASDPQGFEVTNTGTNPNFSCLASCTTLLTEGLGTAIYTGVAATSGLSASGSRSWAYDPTPPVIVTSATGGTTNGNGWYASPIALSATATDAASGVNGIVQVSLDNGVTWQNGTASLSEGVHIVTLWVSDIAGNVGTRQETFKIDATSPAITIATSGTSGSGTWYVSSVTLDALTSDNLSGVAGIQYRVNGGPWTDGRSVALNDGMYTVDFQVFDAAGNLASASQTVNVDTTPPASLVATSGTAGNGNWYVSTTTLTAISSDNLSGMASTQYRVNGGGWTNGSSVILADGISIVDFLASDTAGNSTQISQTVGVDTASPGLAHSIAGTTGNAPWYTSGTTITAMSSDATSGIETIEYSLNGGLWQAGQEIPVGDGIHTLDLRAIDKAGNPTQYSIAVSVDSTPPVSSITSHSDGAVVAATVILSGVSAGGLSGIKSVQLSIDGAPWIEVDHWTETSWDHHWVTGYGMNGSHTIHLRVTNHAGNTSEDSIKVDVENSLPFIFWAAPIPTSTPLPAPTPTFLPTLVPTVPLPKPTAEVSAAPSHWSGIQAVATEAPAEQSQRKILGKGLVRSWRLYTVVAGLFAVFGLTSALDRRPSAHRKTAEILLGMIKNNSQQE